MYRFEKIKSGEGARRAERQSERETLDQQNEFFFLHNTVSYGILGPPFLQA